MIAEWINFGQVSAERDENLSKYFFDNGVLQSVISNRHQFLVLGRKGAGKTAVFQHLSDNPHKYLGANDSSINLSLHNYSWDVHGLLTTEGKASSLAYIHSWKYIIYLFSVKILVDAGIQTKTLNKAKKVIERIYKSPTPTLVQVVGQKLLQLSTLKLPAGKLDLESSDVDWSAGEITFAEVQRDNSLQSTLNRSLERLSELFEDALVEARQIIEYLWRSTGLMRLGISVSFEFSQRIIAGLIGAAEAINSKFKGFLRPVIFLREDIFETLDLNDKNKLRSDCGQLLSWSKDSLARMILERVNFYARKTGHPEIAKIDDIFDREQMRQQRAPFDYIMLRTMLRPRDFIKLFQLVKENMLERKNNPFEDDAISEDRLECQSIYNSEPAYSEWLLEELRDEWRAQYPRINDLFLAIQNHGRTNFTGDDLANALRGVGVDATSGEMIGYLRFLYDNSIIGFRVGKSQQWRFKCFLKTQGFLEFELYKVHDGLHRSLNLTESRTSP